MSRPIRERINLGFAVAGIACAAAWVSACGSGGAKGTSVIEAKGCDPKVDAACGDVGAGCQADAECVTGSCSSGTCAAVGPDGSPLPPSDYFSENDLKYER